MINKRKGLPGSIETYTTTALALKPGSVRLETIKTNFDGYVQAAIVGMLAGNASSSPQNVASQAVSIAIEVEKQIEIQLGAKGKK